MWVDHWLRYQKGNIAYDFPEQVPPYIKEKVYAVQKKIDASLFIPKQEPEIITELHGLKEFMSSGTTIRFGRDESRRDCVNGHCPKGYMITNKKGRIFVGMSLENMGRRIYMSFIEADRPGGGIGTELFEAI